MEFPFQGFILTKSFLGVCLSEVQIFTSLCLSLPYEDEVVSKCNSFGGNGTWNRRQKAKMFSTWHINQCIRYVQTDGRKLFGCRTYSINVIDSVMRKYRLPIWSTWKHDSTKEWLIHDKSADAFFLSLKWHGLCWVVQNVVKCNAFLNSWKVFF